MNVPTGPITPRRSSGHSREPASNAALPLRRDTESFATQPEPASPGFAEPILLILDSGGRIVHANRWLSAITQAPSTEAIGKRLVEVVALQPTVQPFFDPRQIKPEEGEDTLTLTQKTGPTESHRIQWSRTIIRKPSGQIAQAIYAGTDLNEQLRLQLENHLKESAIASSINAIALASPGGEIEYVNQAFLDLWGLDAVTQVVGHSTVEFWQQEEEAKQILEEILKQGRWTGLRSAQRNDGTTFTVEMSATLFQEENQTQRRIMACFVDVTEKLSGEKRLRESQARLKAIFDSSPECVKIVDRQGRLVAMNPAGLEAVEACDWSEVAQAQVVDLVNPEWKQSFLDGIQRACDGEKLLQVFKITGLKGTERWMEQHAVPLQIGNRLATDQMLAVTRDITERKLAEERQASLVKIIEESLNELYVFDRETLKFVEVNRSARANLGYTIDELRQKTPLDIKPELTLARFNRMISPLLCGKQAKLEIQTRHRRKNGSEYEIELHLQLGHYAGRPAIVAVGLDVTQRKLAEAALRESEERLRILVASAPAGVAMFDRDMNYLAYSRRWLTDYRLGEQTLIGRCHYEVFPEIGDRWKEIHRHCLKGFAQKCEEDTFLRADGTVESLRWEVQPWRDAKGEVRGLILFSEMITEQVAAQRKLMTSQARLAKAQKIAKVGDWRWDLASGKLIWSDEVFRIFGHREQSFDPIYQTHFRNVICPQDREKVIQSVRKATRETGHYSIEYRIRAADDSERILREEGQVEFDQFQRPQQLVGTVQDVSAQRQSQQQLVKLREELAHASRLGTMGELASGLAHELNQPLAALELYANAVVEAQASGATETVSQCLNNISQQALRAGEIVRRMRSFVQRAPAKRELADINELTNEVLSLLEHELRKYSIQVCTQLDEDIPPFEIDSIQIQQVLTNLIRNGAEAMSSVSKERRTLTVTTHHSPTGCTLSISDEGCGLPVDLPETVFEPFQSTKSDGLGLGLAISRSLLEAHGSQLVARPNSPQGTTFSFEIPYQTEATER